MGRDGACPVFLGRGRRRGKPRLYTWILFLFSRCEENQDFEFFLDVVEPMLQFRLDKNN